MLPEGFKPLLAGKITKPESLRFPLMVSPKLDGIRCIITPDGARTRSLKEIQNRDAATWLGFLKDHGLDGELIWDEPTYPNVMQATSSCVMSHDADTELLTYYVFDRWDVDGPFEDRYKSLVDLVPQLDSRVVLVEHEIVNNMDELDAAEQRAVDAGYEGLMIRDPKGRYKHGRSSEREGILLKMKRFEDAEAIVVRVDELMHNENEAKTNELGRTHRSSAQAGKVPGGVMGVLVCKCDAFEAEFGIGTGFTAEQRDLFWKQRDELIGKQLTFKYQPHGCVDAPRIPVFKGWREAE